MLNHVQIRDYFMKTFNRYRKPEETKYFIQQWLTALESYASEEGYIAFEPNPPILSKLVPNAIAVLVVPHFLTNVPFRFRHVSIFPIIPYRVKMKHTERPCTPQVEFLKLYLHLTGIRVVGFYKMSYYEKSVLPELPPVDVYLSVYNFKSRVWQDLKIRNSRFLPPFLTFSGRAVRSADDPDATSPSVDSGKSFDAPPDPSG